MTSYEIKTTDLCALHSRTACAHIVILSCICSFILFSCSIDFDFSHYGGILAYGAGGVLLGIGVNKKALFHALPVAVFFFVLSLVLSGFSLTVLLENASKALIYCIATLLAFSRTHKG